MAYKIEGMPCFCPACDHEAEGRARRWGILVPLCRACQHATYRDGVWRCPEHGDVMPIDAKFTQADLWPRRTRAGKTFWFARWETIDNPLIS